MSKFDFSHLLKISKDSPLIKEVSDAAWADYGRKVWSHMNRDGGLEKALTRGAFSCTNTKELAHKIRVYLQTGVIT